MRSFHLHLISDSTGETVSTAARAAVSMFKDVDAIEHSWSLVRTRGQIEKVLGAIKDHPGMVFYTLVEPDLEEALQDGCRKMNIPCIPVLEQVVSALSAYLGATVGHQPGSQHVLDEEYFSRIEAMQFVLAHDDGQSLHDIAQADVILLGVSRTSKTPTCFYLANRGIKAANIPLVPGHPVPEEIFDTHESLIVGLTTTPERLIQIRHNRLRSMGEDSETDYVEAGAVRDEVNEAKRLFAVRKWPVIDVSRRSIEETAAEVLALHRQRVGLD